MDLTPEVTPEQWANALHFVFPSEASRPFGACSLRHVLDTLCTFAPRESERAARLLALLRCRAPPGGLAAELESDLLDALLLVFFTSLPLHGGRTGGRCLMAMLGKSNHACFPNCVVLHSGLLPDEDVREAEEGSLEAALGVVAQPRNTQLRAVTSIVPGEELTWCYGGRSFAVSRSTESRRAWLKKGFEFECCCKLCDPGDTPPSRNLICKHILAYGKPPPFPAGGLKPPPLG